MPNEVEFEILLSQTVNFAMQQNHVQPIHRLRIRNTSGHELRGLTLTVEADPAFVTPYSCKIPLLRARERREITPVLSPVPSVLFSLTESVSGSLTVTLRNSDGTLLQESREMSVLAYDQWQGLNIMPEITASFVTPNHPYIAEIVKRATSRLRRLERGAMFDGYATGSPTSLLKQVEAIYTALCEEGITYQLPPPSFSAGQRLRLADTISETRTGTCIDLALLLSGCLEYVRLHPLLILTESHAFVGCWLVDETFPECIQDDISELTKRTADGIGEICLLECTALTRGKPFSVACEEGSAQLADASRFRYAIDVRRTRLSGIAPIPLRRYDRKGNLLSPDADAREKKQTHSLPAACLTGESATITYTKQQLWERKLLDLSLRNSLLNFRSARRGLQLLSHNLGALERTVLAGGDFTILPRPNELDPTLTREAGLYPVPKDLPEKLLRAELDQKRIRSYADEKELAEALTALYRSGRISVEESGANPLYMAIGFMRWYENGRSTKAYYAPLVLLPVELVRHAAPKGYVLRVREEEPQFNITLLELLRTTFDIQIPGLDPLPRTSDGIDLRQVFAVVRRAIMHMARWDVVEAASIANFSFSRFIMWNDLHNRAADLESNRVVNSLIEGRADWRDAPQFMDAAELDEKVLPADIAAPLPYDSSQLAAIVAAAQGATFVLHGPPGTGKSQTITNMIANALYAGKSVLFIAEKMAALNVVKDRLDKLGLSDFCLELHSDKAKKTDVLANLGHTLEEAHAVSPAGHAEEAGKLLTLRRALNRTMKLIHEVHPCGFSLYDAIARYEQYRNAPELDFFTREHFESMTPAMWRAWEDLIKEYIALANGCGGVLDNPLSIYCKPSYSQSDKPRIAAALEEYLRLSESLQQSLEELCKLIPFGRVKSYHQLSAIASLCTRLADTTVLPAGLVTSDALLLSEDRVARLCETGKRHVQLREVLLFRFDADLLKLDPSAPLRDLRAAQMSNLFVRHARIKAERKRLAVHAKDPTSLTNREIEGVWRMVEEYQSTAKIIVDLLPAGRALFGDLCRPEGSDFGYLERLWRDAYDINRLVRPIADDPEDIKQILIAIDGLASKGDLLSNANLFRSFAATFTQISALESRIAALCDADPADWHTYTDWIVSERVLFRRAEERLDSLRDYCSYRFKREEMIGAGLGALTAAAESGKVKLGDLLSAFYRNASLSIATFLLEADPNLAAFSGVMMEQKIQEYNRVCDRFAAMTVQELRARLCARIPVAAEPAASSELATLGRAIRSGGRGMSLRKLFDSIPHLLRRLSPCMLMSPLSVAQYLDPSQPLFDLVIFDEASQMPTCEAVGAIARGKNLIVVGDPKQLPPTTFFTTTHFDEDNYEREDLDSLLDDCLALSMPQLHLLWHYRSRHESLIAFSNRQYYDNHLFTFPSPTSPVSRVTLVPVDGIYDRGRTKQNRAEAEAVVSEVVRRLRTPAYDGQSIGIVTFSSVQQLLIEDLLEARLSRQPELEEKAANMYEPIFVKNLENVQGDERDVILFSVCYGPDRTGHVGMNFGPLNRDGGWRRLNVAVSRARQEMMIFSTLQPEQIDLDRCSSEGVAGLRAFLEYARDGMEALASRSSEERPPYGLGDCIAEMLRDRGYRVDTNVGESSCKIDAAVIDPKHEGEYLLGILCDSTPPSPTSSARDRNILRENVLTSLGWRLHHVWSVDFWDAPTKEFDKILKAIDAARRQARRAEKVLTASSAPAPLNAPAAVGAGAKTDKVTVAKTASKPVMPGSRLTYGERVTYKVTKTEPVAAAERNADAFFDPKNAKRVLYLIREILITEAPVSFALIRRRVADAWGIRPTPRMDSYLVSLLAQTRCSARREGDVTFYWSLGQIPEEYAQWRVPATPAERRAPEDIPREELAVAFAAITEEQLSLSKEDAAKTVARYFGYARPTVALQPRLQAGLELAIARHTVTERDGQLISPNA